MTPQEKAKEIVDKYLLEVRGADRYNYNLDSMNLFIAKQCALIAVDEVLSKRLVAHLPWKEVDYWEQVKTEIEKL